MSMVNFLSKYLTDASDKPFARRDWSIGKNDKREDYAKERKERRQKLNLDEETPQQQRKHLLQEQQEQHMHQG